MQAESTPGALHRRRTHRSLAETRAYEAFHLGFFVPLAAYCMVDLHDWHAAEEVAGDALMTLWRNWRHLHRHDDRTLRAYAFQTVRYRLLRVAPRQRRQSQQTVPLGWAPTAWTTIPPSSIPPAATSSRTGWTDAWRACSMPRSGRWSRASARRCCAAMATGTRWPR